MLRVAAAIVMTFATCVAQAAANSGTLTIVGSDTLSALLLRWMDAFRAQHPEALIQLQTPGSASAPIALLEGAADIGMMSRPMSAKEKSAFEQRFGYAPAEIVVAHDAIVVFVHPDNPMTRITRKELDAIYSATRRCGADSAATQWSDLGEASVRPILVTGRNNASGTSEFFREQALCGGEYRADVVVWPGHGATVAAVAGNPEAIGYAGIGYVNGLVKPLAFALDDAAPAVEPVMQNVMDGEYALSRALYFYINQPPGHAPAALPAAFVDYALSDDAQAQVKQEGFLAATREERDTQRTRLHATIPSS